MSRLPFPLYRADQVRRLDHAAVVGHGIPGITLMERAGAAAWQVLHDSWPQADRMMVICGSGNNAGDGYVFARLALEHGCKVRVMSLMDPVRLTGDAATAAQSFLAAGGVCENYSAPDLEQADIIVDALLGTGIDRPVSGAYLESITAINNSGKAILSLDIPTGLHADSGQVLGEAVRADVTVSFIGLKAGMFTGDGAEYSGRIFYSDLDVPAEIFTEIKPYAHRIDQEVIDRLLGKRKRNAHKGDFGHVLVVGGDYGFAGAARMAGEAAARSGAGLTTIATRPEHAWQIPSSVPELMARGIDLATDLNPLLERATVIAIGPGLGQSQWSLSLLSRILESNLPVVADADALNLIAREPSVADNWILTPHPGEAARLLGCSRQEVQADRYAAAVKIRQHYGGVTVLKGSGTVIADDSDTLYVCDAGNPGMATGGMGDVLTGVIAGFLAQGMSGADAARAGVLIHARAADQAAAEAGERGLMATDLMPWIHRFANP